MDRLKQLSKQYGQWKDLAIYIERIEYNLDSDFGAAIGNSKSLIECICKTILHEQETSYFLINCVENIACFLIDFYEIEYPRTKQTPDRKYIDYQDFNEYLDNLYGNIHMIGLSYSTSEILFLIDQVAYLDKYQEYLGEINETH